VSHPTLFEEDPRATTPIEPGPRPRRRGSSTPFDDTDELDRPALFERELLDDLDETDDDPDPGDEDSDSRAELPDADRLDDLAEDDDEDPFDVVVIRSARRKRSVGAQLRGRTLQITIPTWMSRIEEEKWVASMVARYRRKQATDRIDLKDRAMTLARRHDLPFPREIRWVDDMTTRWGSCTPTSGTIRMSSRLGNFPEWVIDYVIVHELSHLEHADHSAAFWKVVHRYPKTERAIGYLIAKAGDVEWED
jgi:predicted metal-dependent hydrolase